MKALTNSLRSMILFGAAANFAIVADSPFAFAAEEVVVTDIPIVQSHFQLGAQTSLRSTQGNFDAYGNYAAYPSESYSRSWTTNFNLSYRFTSLFEAGLLLPVRYSQTELPTGSMTSTAAGGPSFDMRFHFGGWAHWISHFGLSLPWRWSTRQMNGDPMASLPDDLGDSSQGGTALRFGVGASHSFNPIRAALDATVSYPLATEVALDPSNPNSPFMTLQKAVRLQLREGISYALHPRWGVHGSLKQSWAGLTQVNAQEIQGTASRIFSSSLGMSYTMSSTMNSTSSSLIRWTMAYETAFPFYAYAANQAYAPTLNLGMTYTP